MTGTLTSCMMDKEAVGRRLRQARKATGLTREAVRQRIGFDTVGAIQHHENGRSLPDAPTLAFYARTYKVSVDWILTGKGRGPGDVKDETAEAIRLLDDMPEPERQRALNILRQLK